MSHAANLRNRGRPSISQAPAKRRKISPTTAGLKSNGITAILNGVSPGNQKLAALPIFNPKSHNETRPDIVNVTVGQGGDTEDVEMDDASINDASEEDEEELASSEDEGADQQDFAEESNTQNGHSATQSNSTDLVAGQQNSEADQQGEPSFGDLLRARGPELITVEATSAHESSAPKTLAAQGNSRTLSIPSATSLGTVLTQALKTNDVDLLESCLQVPSLESIRATVQRLNSSLATTLLQRLAERLHKRPGRAGSLMVWVQWTIVAHGGYLASQPAAMKQLHTLYSVVKQRATGLQPLLALKGRLDMLEAQMQMRRTQSDSIRRGITQAEGDEGIIYVEGEEDEGNNEEVNGQSRSGSGGSKRQAPEETGTDDEEEDMPDTLPDGIDASVDEEEEEGSSDEDDKLIDDEAEETADDSDDLSEGVDYEDVDQAGESSDEEEEVEERPVKRSTAAQRNSLRRR